MIICIYIYILCISISIHFPVVFFLFIYCGGAVLCEHDDPRGLARSWCHLRPHVTWRQLLDGPLDHLITCQRLLRFAFLCNALGISRVLLLAPSLVSKRWLVESLEYSLTFSLTTCCSIGSLRLVSGSFIFFNPPLPKAQPKGEPLLKHDKALPRLGSSRGKLSPCRQSTRFYGLKMIHELHLLVALARLGLDDLMKPRFLHQFVVANFLINL